MKKFIAIVTFVAVAAWIPMTGASADTISDLQAQILALQAQLNTLLGTGTTGTTTTCTFTRALYPGVTGTDVKCLQQYLNGTTFKVAVSGVGSAGYESEYYGSKTQAAVAAWQAGNGVACGSYCGYFGPISQVKYTALANTGGTGSTGGTGTTGTTGCQGTEGSYTVTLSSEPVSRTVNAGDGLEAWGMDVKAVNSDITIGKVDLRVAVVNATTAVAENPGNFVKTLKVYKGSVSAANLVKTFASPVFTQDTAAIWYSTMGDLGFVVPMGTTVKLLVVMDTGTTIDQNRTVTVQTYLTNGIRGRDCKGIDSYANNPGNRVLTVQQPGVATVTITTAADNPNSNNIKADATSGVQTQETLLSLNAKATAGNSTLTRLEVTYASAASAVVLPSILYLYDGSTLVSSATPNATENGAATFENFRLPLTQDVVKNLKIKANWTAATAFESGGAAYVLNAPASTAANSAGGTHERANGQIAGVVTSAAIASFPQWIAESGLYLTFVSGTSSFTPQGTTAGVGTVTGTLVFKAKPFGGALVEPAYASNTGTSAAAAVVTSGMLVRVLDRFTASAGGFGDGVGIIASAGQYTVALSLQSNPTARNITEGEEATITVVESIGLPIGPGALAGNVRFKVEDICSNVGGTLRCQGSSSGIAGATTGNLTDNWFTNETFLAQ